MTNEIQKVHELGQSLWYDNIHRELLNDGTLAGMIEAGEIRGVTSNPSIFNKAISQSDVYNQAIQDLTKAGKSRDEIYEALAVDDIQRAADLFRPLYDETQGGDGYVSLEVSPYLAHDTEGTIEEAKRLWKLVDRPNLMVKIPATLEGLPAITEAISSGININVTLIFGLGRYQAVREAYLEGLEKRHEAGKSIKDIASVASFFISRIDTKVDNRLSEMSEAGAKGAEKAQTLFGKIAIASGKLAYRDFRSTFSSDNDVYQKVKEAGGNLQRVLWASTSTKNPAYSDVRYVEEMIGPDTVNTVPHKTLDAFKDHGKAALTIDQGVQEAQKEFQQLSELGIDMDVVTQELEDEGVKSFAESFTSLLETIEERKESFS
jgi:transaldolase